MHDVPAWTRPGARWVFWMCWVLLCLNVVVLVWRVAQGDQEQAVYPAVMAAVFAGLLVANRANRRRRAGRS
jgi:L-asparagine transporter-like permease